MIIDRHHREGSEIEGQIPVPFPVLEVISIFVQGHEIIAVSASKRQLLGCVAVKAVCERTHKKVSFVKGEIALQVFRQHHNRACRTALVYIAALCGLIVKAMAIE